MKPDDEGASTGSPFLAFPQTTWVGSNELAFAVRDHFPVTRGHSLVISRRVIPDWWSATAEEQSAMMSLVAQVKRDLDVEFVPDGYNVGFNDGDAAGQTIAHLHVHVIPRYEGDVQEPLGGIRHVIPEKANYVALAGVDRDWPSIETPGPTTELEKELATIVDSSALTQWLLRIIEEGRRSATYKPALLLAIIELAMEHPEITEMGEPAGVRIELEPLADRVIEYYWPQTRPNPFANSGVLKQATTERSRILDAVSGLRVRSHSAVHADIAQVRLTHASDYDRARRKVVKALAKQPIPRLQRPGKGAARDGYWPRLYDDADFEPERGALVPDAAITLRPGVASALAKNATVLRQAIQTVWAREVAVMNGVNSDEEELRDFLFGTHRGSLHQVADGLADIGQTRCFWCDRPLSRARTNVDHVIPWSHYPSNELFNLVLSDSECNNSKSANLVTPDLVQRWLERDSSLLQQVSEAISWPLQRTRSVKVAHSAYSWLPEGVPVWRGRGDIIAFDQDQRQQVLSVLST